MSLLIVISSVDSEKKANKLAKKLVKEKLAACVSIFSSSINSHYVWKDKQEIQQEYLMLIKTIPDNFNALKAFLEKNHPYKTPEIISFKAEDCNQSYLNWVIEQTKTSS
ncbi:MAG: divalent-cation tolerance protein CutA [Neisseriaceae bacterium]|nr:divalent-cation tolerance protein CutA [Neisseriaceae bacterium]MCV2509665.1 divalent-cation tolerance protein CutA [Neisseriaceae bacterium]